MGEEYAGSRYRAGEEKSQSASLPGLRLICFAKVADLANNTGARHGSGENLLNQTSDQRFNKKGDCASTNKANLRVTFMVIRAINKMFTNGTRNHERTQSIFRRIHGPPCDREMTARAMYEIKRSILRKLAGRLGKHNFSRRASLLHSLPESLNPKPQTEIPCANQPIRDNKLCSPDSVPNPQNAVSSFLPMTQLPVPAPVRAQHRHP
jgi:hypothetical protein